MSGLFSAKEAQKSNVTQVTACKDLAYNIRSLIFWLQKHPEFSKSFIKMNIFTFFNLMTL